MKITTELLNGAAATYLERHRDCSVTGCNHAHEETKEAEPLFEAIGKSEDYCKLVGSVAKALIASVAKGGYEEDPTPRIMACVVWGIQQGWTLAQYAREAEQLAERMNKCD